MGGAIMRLTDGSFRTACLECWTARLLPSLPDARCTPFELLPHNLPHGVAVLRFYAALTPVTIRRVCEKHRAIIRPKPCAVCQSHIPTDQTLNCAHCLTNVGAACADLCSDTCHAMHLWKEHDGKSFLRAHTCFACGTVAHPMKRCTQCNVAFFCGAECQQKAWNDHKAECAIMAKARLAHSDPLVTPNKRE